MLDSQSCIFQFCSISVLNKIMWIQKSHFCKAYLFLNCTRNSYGKFFNGNLCTGTKFILPLQCYQKSLHATSGEEEQCILPRVCFIFFSQQQEFIHFNRQLALDHLESHPVGRMFQNCCRQKTWWWWKRKLIAASSRETS